MPPPMSGRHVHFIREDSNRFFYLPHCNVCLECYGHSELCPMLRHVVAGKPLACDGNRIIFNGVQVMECPMKKPMLGSEGEGAGKAVDDKWLVDKVPYLLDALTSVKWDDGTKRERSTVSVFIEDGIVKVCLNDKNLQASLYRSAASILGALQALDKALSPAGDQDWRLWKKGKR
jgi:hypothetical protein